MCDRLSQRLFIPALERHSPKRLAVSAPGVKIIRSLPLNERQFRSGQLRLKLSDDLKRDFVLEIERIRRQSVASRFAFRFRRRRDQSKFAHVGQKRGYCLQRHSERPVHGPRDERPAYDCGEQKLDERAMTKKPGTRASKAITSSTRPSASGSRLRLSDELLKGSNAIDG
jgi:hypothetical protein